MGDYPRLRFGLGAEFLDRIEVGTDQCASSLVTVHVFDLASVYLGE